MLQSRPPYTSKQLNKALRELDRKSFKSVCGITFDNNQGLQFFAPKLLVAKMSVKAETRKEFERQRKFKKFYGETIEEWNKRNTR